MTAQAGGTAFLPRKKADLRLKLQQRRATLTVSERRKAAESAAGHLLRVLRACQVRHVAVYLSFGDELDTGPLLELLQRKSRRQGIAALRRACPGHDPGSAILCRRIFQIYAPKLRGGRMVFVALKRGTALRRNRFSISEPAASPRAARLDAIVLPLLGFDNSGRRLGQGGGYYDRVLANPRSYRRPLRLGFAYAIQEVAEIPANAQDARLDAVVTERGLHRFCRSGVSRDQNESRLTPLLRGE